MSPAVTRMLRTPTLRADVVAGVTAAIVLVPQAMGYALLAGLPPIAGLHASIFGLLVYAALGSSSSLAIGPVAMDSLLVGVALSSVVPVSAPERLALAGFLAVFVGTIQLAMGAMRLGSLTNFLSLPVLTGFTSAAALMILANQLPSLLGIRPAGSSDLVPLVRHVASSIRDVSLPTLTVGATSIALAVALERLRPNWPRAPIVLAYATLVVALVPGFESVRRVGEVARELPHPSLALPSLEQVRTLAPHALTIAFVAFIEAHSVAKKFADRCGEPSPSRELVALGATNVVTGFSGGFPITGGLGRSAVLVRAGAQTRFAGVVTAITVALSLLLLAPLFAAIPRAALDAVVVTSVVALVDVPGMKRIREVKPTDAAFVGVAFVSTLALSFQWGIVIGIAASLASFVRESTRPHVAVLGRIPGTQAYRNVLRYPEAETVPGMLLVRIDSQLYFGNATFLREVMDELTARAEPIDAIVVDASGVGQLDSSAESALSRLVDGYERRGIRFALASVRGPVRDVLRRSGLWARLGRERLFLDVHSAVEALRTPTPVSRGSHALSPAI